LRLLQNELDITITPIEPPIEQSVKVYPNPAREFVKILSTQAVSLTVFSVNGTMIQQNIPVRENQEKEISTLNWTPGLYVLEFKTGSTRVVRKIVIQ